MEHFTKAAAVLAVLALTTPLAISMEAEPPAASVAVDAPDGAPQAPAIPPPGLGASDPWVDARGDVLFGDLDLGPHAVVLDGQGLRADGAGVLWFGTYRVCVVGATSGCSGTVTRVDAGAGLAGGPITGEGALSIAEGGVTSAMLADGAVAEADLGFDPATQAELDALAAPGSLNDAANPVHWTRLAGVPAGFADGADADTTYSAGAGISLDGTTFAADAAYLQRRVAACAEGASVRAVAEDGAVTCELDDDTTYSAGAGVTITGGVVSADSTYLQRRLAECAQGYYLRAAAQDGSVTCDPDVDTDTLAALACAEGQVAKLSAGAWKCAADADSDTTYAAGDGLSLASGTFAVDFGAAQRRVASACAVGSSIRSVNADGTVTCETDDDADTTYSASDGLTLTGTTFAVDYASVQKRVAGGCGAGSSIRAVSDAGGVTCEADDDALGAISCASGQVLKWASAWGCGTDANTQYSAGAGVTLDGNAIAVDAGYVQRRVATCATGSSIRSIAEDGAVTCEVDDSSAATYTGSAPIAVTGSTIGLSLTGCDAGDVWKWDGAAWTCVVDADTTYSAGSGLALAGGAFSVDPSTYQRRVAGACAAGSSIRAVAQDGTVTCETDTDTDTDSLGALACTEAQIPKRVGGAWACGADANTQYSAGLGLTLSGTTLSADTTVLQRRVTTSCAGQVLVSIAAAGSATCEADDVDGGDAATVDGLDGLQFLRADAATSYTGSSLDVASGSTLRIDGTLDAPGTTKVANLTDRDAPQYFVDPSAAQSMSVKGNLWIGNGSETDRDAIFFDQGKERVEWYESYGSRLFWLTDNVTASGDLDVGGKLDVSGDEIEVGSYSGGKLKFEYSDFYGFTGYGIMEYIAGYLTSGKFSFNSEVEAPSLATRGVLKMGEGMSSDSDQSIHFRNGGNVYGESIKWADAADRFEISDDVFMGGAVVLSNHAEVYGNFRINSNGPDATSYLYFYEDGSPTAEYVAWDNVNDRFYVSDDTYVAGVFSQASASRFKENVRTIADGLQKVLSLRGVTYDWKADGRHDVGFIAEEVAEVVPEIVAYGDDGQVDGLDYGRVTALLVEAVKDQQRQIEEKDARLADLEARLAALEALVTSGAAAASG